MNFSYSIRYSSNNYDGMDSVPLFNPTTAFLLTISRLPSHKFSIIKPDPSIYILHVATQGQVPPCSILTLTIKGSKMIENTTFVGHVCYVSVLCYR